jgi:hypothetical protein
MSDPELAVVLLEALLSVPFVSAHAEPEQQWIDFRGFSTQLQPTEHRLFYSVSDDFYDDVDRSQYSQILLAQRDVFQTVLDRLAELWEAPDFISHNLYREGPPGTATRLEEELYWRGGIALAYWFKADRVAYVELEHQDKELPIVLILGVCIRDCDATDAGT